MSNTRKWIIPLWILTAVVSNQLDKEFWPIIGRVLGWGATLVAIYIIGKRFSWNNFSTIFILVFLSSKILQIFFSSDIINASYYLFQAILLSVTGLIIFRENYVYIHRQLYRFAIINIIVMIVQITGIFLFIFGNDISQFLATHTNHIPLGLPLFNTSNYFNVLQARPAGITYSNQWLCLPIIAISTIHFASPYNKFGKNTWVIILLIVLCMAKVVFFSFFVLSIFLLLFGKNFQRKNILFGIAWLVIFLSLYKVIFPGLFEVNLNISQIILSITTRLGVVLYALFEKGFIGWSTVEFINNNFPTNYEIGAEFKWITDLTTAENTGYLVVIKNFRYIIYVLIMILPLFIYKSKKMIDKGNRQFLIFSIAMIIGLVMTSSVGPLWKAPFCMIMSGAALLPIFDYHLLPYSRKIY